MQIKISKKIAVNPRHVMIVGLDPKTLKTGVLLVGNLQYTSDFDFDNTIKLLNGESIIER